MQCLIWPVSKPSAVHTQIDATRSFSRLDNHRYRLCGVPFKTIGLARGLSDKGFPVDVRLDIGIAGTVSHPAYNSVRVNSKCGTSLHIAENERIAVY